METAARTDRRDASTMAAAVRNAAEDRRGKAWSGGSSKFDGDGMGGETAGTNPDEFEPLMYAQLALTSPAVNPDDCRWVREGGWNRRGGGGRGGEGRGEGGHVS